MAKEIEVKIVLDENLRAEMKKASNVVKGESKKMRSSLSGVASSVKKVAIAYVGFRALKATAGIIFDTAKAAGNLNEALSKQSTVFRGFEATVSAGNKELQKSYGLARVEAAKFTSTIQDTLVPLGIARGEAAKMSFETVKLARDLASFNNLPTEQVVNDIQSALVGNVETLRKYGVALNQATIEQKAIEMGLIKTKAQLTPTSKAMAIMQLTVEGSGDAVGDFARTSDSFNNQLEIMKSAALDAKGALGNIILQSEGFQMALTAMKRGIIGLKNAFLELQDIERIKKFTNLQLERNKIALEWQNIIGEQEKKMTKYQDSEGKVLSTYRLQATELMRSINIHKQRAKAQDDDIKKQLEGLKIVQDASGDGEDSGSKGKGKGKGNKSTIDENKERFTGWVKWEVEQQTLKNEEDAKLRKENQDAINAESEKMKADAIALQEKITQNDIKESNKRIAMAKLEAEATVEAKKRVALMGASLVTQLAGLNKDASKENFLAFQVASIAEAGVVTAMNTMKALGNPPFPGVNVAAASLAAGLGAVQIAKIASQKPPAFEQGGIVEGESFSGDRVNIRANSGEMILNRKQQDKLLAIAEGRSTGGGLNVNFGNTIINGDADQDTIDAIEQSREKQLNNLREMIIELQAGGQMPAMA